MNSVLLQQEIEPAKHSSYLHELFDRSEQIFRQHRLENPDLYRMVEERRIIHLKEANIQKTVRLPALQVDEKVSTIKSLDSIYFKQNIQKQLKSKIGHSS